MEYTKYEKYKDSGVERLGEIPDGWKVKRVKDDVLSNCKTLSEKTNGNYEIQYIEISGVEIGGVINNPEKLLFKDAPSRARRIVRKNDVIISTVRIYLKAVAYFDTVSDNLICSTGFSVLPPRKTIFPTYLKYVILSENFIDKVISNSKGVSYPAINNLEQLYCYPIIKPSQREFFDFLRTTLLQTHSAFCIQEPNVNILC
jgi:type I restriction enzyme, S subunit